MDTNALETFVLVARQRSFAAAAREQNIDPSSVSRVVGALENELGVRLFQRNSRRLSLTEAGAIYLQRIEPLIDEIKHARDAVVDASEQLQGTLRITASNSFGVKVVMPQIPQFTAKYPELSVDVVLTDAVVDLVAERFDLAIRLGRLVDSNLVAKLFMHTRYRVVASPNYLRSHAPIKKPNDLSARDAILFPLPGFRSRWMFRDRQGDTSEVSVKGRITVSSAIGLQQCALGGCGPALLPAWLIEENLADGKLVDVLPKWEVAATNFDTAAWFVYPSRTYVPLKVRAFMEFMRQNVRAER